MPLLTVAEQGRGWGWGSQCSGVDTPFWHTGLFMGVFGVGLGFVLQPITLAVQNAREPQDIGVATSSVTFFRQMGATAGTAIFLSLLFSTVGDKIQDAYPPARRSSSRPSPIRRSPASRPILAALNGGGGVGDATLNDTSFLTRVAPVLARPFEDGFSPPWTRSSSSPRSFSRPRPHRQHPARRGAERLGARQPDSPARPGPGRRGGRSHRRPPPSRHR